ncbi:MAG: hypothetical protein HY700_05190 [Gemmatimonadetes bacterium]|nr:hypothetical protein [Gemmatimonadota bacterium]
MTSARDQIVRILQSLTDISAAELGRRVGVSRERVRQILKDLGYPTARGKGRPYGSTVLTAVGTAGDRRVGRAAAIQIVAEDLLAKGFAIFAPVRATKACDLIAIEGNGALNLIRIGTSLRSRSKPGEGRRSRGTGVRQEKSFRIRHALVVPGNPIRYDPPFGDESPSVTRGN